MNTRADCWRRAEAAALSYRLTCAHALRPIRPACSGVRRLVHVRRQPAVAFDPTRSWEDSAARPPWPAQLLDLQSDLFRLDNFSTLAAGVVRYIPIAKHPCRLSAAVAPNSASTYSSHARALPRYVWRGTALMRNRVHFRHVPGAYRRAVAATISRSGPGSGASAACSPIRCIVRHRRARPFRRPAPGHGRASTWSDSMRAIATNLRGYSIPRYWNRHRAPWLVVEDAHHNVAAVLGHVHAYLRRVITCGRRQRRQARGTARVSRLSSGQLPGRHALYRQFRPQRHLRRRLDLHPDDAGRHRVRGVALNQPLTADK